MKALTINEWTTKAKRINEKETRACTIRERHDDVRLRFIWNWNFQAWAYLNVHVICINLVARTMCWQIPKSRRVFVYVFLFGFCCHHLVLFCFVFFADATNVKQCATAQMWLWLDRKSIWQWETEKNNKAHKQIHSKRSTVRQLLIMWFNKVSAHKINNFRTA